MKVLFIMHKREVNMMTIYITRGVQCEVPVILQIFMWSMIERIDVHRDYLQIFRLKPIGNNKVIIEHEQEQPKYKDSITVEEVTLEGDLKVYVIIENEYMTMMLAEEY